MVKTRIEVFPEIRDHIDFFETLPEYDIAMYTHKKMKTNAETSLKVLKDVLPILEAQEDFSNDALFAALSAYVSETGVKTGFVMWPVRTAVSGKQMLLQAQLRSWKSWKRRIIKTYPQRH